MYYTNDGINLYQGDMIVGDRVATQAEINTYLANDEMLKFKNDIQKALDETTITVQRIHNAIVLGRTTALTQDIIDFLNYIDELRALLSSTSVISLPTKPPYPANT